MKLSVTLQGMDKILRRLAANEGRAAAAGIFPDKAHRSDGKSNAEIGLANEFGVPDKNIPERAHLRTAFQENQHKYVSILAKEGTLEEVSKVISEDIVKKISTGPFVPNAPATLKKKEGDKPLIDTHEYQEAIQGRVIKL